MSGLSKVNLVSYEISLVARALTIELREITSIIIYAITLISLAIKNVFAWALLHVKILIDMFSASFARILAWESCNTAACIDN